MLTMSPAAAKQFNVKKFTDDAMEVIEDPEVDAVWICSPSQFHAEQIKAAAANKKHVFCEKPIATDLGETVEAINACNAAGVKLMIGLQRRFDQNFKRVKEAVQNREVGEPIMVRDTYLYWEISDCDRIHLIFQNASPEFHRSSCALVIPLRHPSLTSKAAAESSLTWRCTILT
jgi:predicted dehydrogenase